MPKTLALMTIHGMGDTPRDYYAELFSDLRRKVGPAIWSRVLFKPLYYQDILQGQQAQIYTRMRPHIDWLTLRKFLLYGFSDAASLEYKKDALNSPYYATQKAIFDTLDEVYREAGDRALPVVVLGQSLGCQVISSYLWDAQAAAPEAGIWRHPPADGVEPESPRDDLRRLRTLKRLYTTGCNIPIFVAGHSEILAITPPNDEFRWYNFYDEDDVLGWPLRPLSPSYDALVEDIAVNAGGGALGAILKSWNPFSHGQYWSDGEVLRHLVATLKDLA